MHQLGQVAAGATRLQVAIANASMAKSLRSEREACQPTTMGEYTSMMNAA
jgi:hypothetical protein